MVAAREAEGEGGRLLKPSGAQAEEMGATEAQELSGGFRVEVAVIESIERLVDELRCEAFGKLMFCMGPLSPRRARRARLFVGLRYAPASSKPGSAGGRPSPILFPQESHFVPAPTEKSLSLWSGLERA